MPIHSYNKIFVNPEDAPDYKDAYCTSGNDIIGQDDFDEILKKSNILSIRTNNVNMCFSYKDVEYMLQNNKNLLTNKILNDYEKNIMKDFIKSKPYYYDIVIQTEGYDQANDLQMWFYRCVDDEEEQIFTFILIEIHMNVKNRENLKTLIDFLDNKIPPPSPIKFYGETEDSYASVAVISFNPEPLITIYYDKKFKTDDQFLYHYVRDSEGKEYTEIYNKINIFTATNYSRYSRLLSETFVQRINTEKVRHYLERYERIFKVVKIYKKHNYDDKKFIEELEASGLSENKIKGWLQYSKRYYNDEKDYKRVKNNKSFDYENEDEDYIESDLEEYE